MSYTAHGAPEAKKACKGILKTSSSFDKHNLASNRKSAKFDELNVLQTYHPADKDYGHMKIEEPKTPYRVADDEDSIDGFDANLLAEKLEMVAKSDDSSEEETETEDQRRKRLEFEKRRKAHYNEFDAVRRARQLMEAEEEDDDDDNNATDSTPADKKKYVLPSPSDNSLDNVDEHCMDVDEIASQSTSSATASIAAAASAAVASTSST